MYNIELVEKIKAEAKSLDACFLNCTGGALLWQAAEEIERLGKEIDVMEGIAQQGYQEAYNIIMDLRDRMQDQAEECEKEIEMCKGTRDLEWRCHEDVLVDMETACEMIFKEWRHMADIEKQVTVEVHANADAEDKVNFDKVTVRKWEKTRLLERFSEETKQTVANALEQQRLYNEELFDTPGIAAFKRTSIPIVVRVLEKLFHRAWAKVKITSEVIGKYGRYHEIDSSLKWDIYDEENRPQWEAYQLKLDYETNYVDAFSNRIADAIVAHCEINDYKEFSFRAFGVNKEGTYVVYGDFKK